MALFLSVELVSWMPARLRGLYDSDRYLPAVPRILWERHGILQTQHCALLTVHHMSYISFKKKSGWSLEREELEHQD